ncbi:MAG TPA: TIGR02281 family clan AA aspartic protease [Beijerinckiaceae bacterium]
MRLVSVVMLILGAGAALLLLPDEEGLWGLTPGQTAWAIAMSLLVLAYAAQVAPSFRGRLGAAVLSLFAWAAIFAAVMVGYVYRFEVGMVADRVMDEIAPGRALPSQPGEAVAVRRADGHYAFDGLVNGVKTRLMFDTGASSVVLRAEDAGRIGFDPKDLQYRVTVSTANGRTQAAPVTIDALTIGGITERRVRALVARPGALHENLLGQSFLERLQGYSVERNRLVLRR